MGITRPNWSIQMAREACVKRGKVYLVGAGPGDPKLITLKGAEALARADVIINDRLANPRLLKLARPDAEIIYAGKASRDHSLTQDEIIQVIIEKALHGKTVVRLKGGDPFVFGRGGEEAIALKAEGIEFEVIPGVSSAIAAPAYAGIPVTHRNCAASFGIITGHEAPGKPESDIKWDKISTGLDTLVFLMGMEHLPDIVDTLIRNGRSPDTPVALVRWGTCPAQQTLTGTLADIVFKARESGFKAPAVTIVGKAVNLREQIMWFETKPLFGKRIIVTRAESSASVLSDQLEELGAQVDEYPVIKFIPPTDPTPLDDAIAHLSNFDWIIFTSANGVEWFIKRVLETGGDIRALGCAKLGAIGPKTAAALEQLKLKVDYVPSEYIAEAIIREFPENISGKNILITRAKEAREELPEGLKSLGADVTVVSVYETARDDSHANALRSRLTEGDIDIITFTSASTVKNFMTLIGDIKVPDSVIAACIGPITADTARTYGLDPVIIASDYTIEGLVKALIDSRLQDKK